MGLAQKFTPVILIHPMLLFQAYPLSSPVDFIYMTSGLAHPFPPNRTHHAIELQRYPVRGQLVWRGSVIQVAGKLAVTPGTP